MWRRRLHRSKESRRFSLRFVSNSGESPNIYCTKNSGEKETEVGPPIVSCVMRSACCLTSRRDTAGCAAVNLFTRICAIIAVIRITPPGWPFNYRLLCSPLCVRAWEYVPVEWRSWIHLQDDRWFLIGKQGTLWTNKYVCPLIFIIMKVSRFNSAPTRKAESTGGEGDRSKVRMQAVSRLWSNIRMHLGSVSSPLCVWN